MGKNLIPLITKGLGVEIGEEFEIQGGCGSKYRLNEDALEVNHESKWERSGLPINALGNIEIIKLPFKPKHLERYYTYENYNWDVVVDFWEGTMGDYALQIACCVFRTKEEAEKARPKIYKRLTGKEWDKRGDEDGNQEDS